MFFLTLVKSFEPSMNSSTVSGKRALMKEDITLCGYKVQESYQRSVVHWSKWTCSN